LLQSIEKEEHKKKVWMWIYIGMEYWAKKQYQKAILYCNKALEFDVDNYSRAKTYYRLWTWYRTMKKYKEAVSYLWMAIWFYPFCREYQIMLWWVYTDMWKYEEALICLKSGIIIMKKTGTSIIDLSIYNDALIYKRIAFCYYKLWKHKLALDYTKLWLKVDKNDKWLIKNKKIFQDLVSWQ